MKIEAITNRIIPIKEIIRQETSDAEIITIASAFIDHYAIDMLEEALKKNKKIKEVRLLVVIYGGFNRKSDLAKLTLIAK